MNHKAESPQMDRGPIKGMETTGEEPLSWKNVHNITAERWSSLDRLTKLPWTAIAAIKFTDATEERLRHDLRVKTRLSAQLQSELRLNNSPKHVPWQFRKRELLRCAEVVHQIHVWGMITRHTAEKTLASWRPILDAFANHTDVASVICEYAGNCNFSVTG